MPVGDVEPTSNAAHAEPPSPAGVGAPAPVTATPGSTYTGELQSSLPTKLDAPKEQIDAWHNAITRYEREAKALGREPRAAPVYLETGRLWEELLGKQRNAAMCYQRAFQLAPKDPSVLHASRRLFAEVGKWEMVGQILRAQIDAEANTTRKARLCSELGLLSEYRLGSAKDAEKAYQEALTAWPSEPVAIDGLTRIAASRGEFRLLHDVLAKALASVDTPPAKLEILERLADLAEVFLDDPNGAIEHWKVALEIEPTHQRAMEALRRLYASNSRWEELEEILTRTARVSEQGRAVELLASAARVASERLHAPDRAILSFLSAFELDQKNAGLLLEMEALYAENENWDEVAKVVRAELSILPPERRAAEALRLAEILDVRLGDVAGAIDAYREARQLAPDDAFVAARLKHAYATAGRFPELADSIEQGLEKLSDADRLGQLLDLADLYQLRLSNPVKALETLMRAHALAPTSRFLLARMARLGEADKNWEKVVEWTLAEAELHEDPSSRATLLLRAASICDRQLGEIEKAEQLLRQANALNAPFDGSSELLSLLERRGDWAAAYALQSELLKSAGSDAAAVSLRLGHLAEVVLGPDAAILDYERALEADPSSKSAREALSRLLRVKENWKDLARVLDATRETASSDADRRFASEEVARIAERLGDPAAAISAYEAILASDPASTLARAALSRLYVAIEDGERLADLWAHSAGSELADAATRARAACRAAEIFETLGRPERAEELYRTALALLPEHQEASLGLATLLAAGGAWEGLIELYARQAQNARPEQATSLRIRVAQIFLAKLKNPAAALESLALAGPAAAPWVNLAKAVEGADAWHASLEASIEGDESTERRVARQLRIAARRNAAKEGTEDPTPLWRAALDALPAHPTPLGELEIAYRKSRTFDALFALYELRAQSEAESSMRSSFAFRAAELAELRLSKIEDAFRLYSLALKELPGSLPALSGLRRAAAAIGDADTALDCLEKEGSLSADATRAVELDFEAGVIHQDQRADLPKAIERFTAVLAKVPTHEGAFQRLRAILEQKADFPALIALLESRAAQAPKEQRAELMMAIARIEEEQLLESGVAESRYREVLAVDPDNRAALGRLGRILFEAKRFDDALPVLERSALLHSSMAEIHHDEALELARVYRDLGFIFLDHRRDLVRCVECLQAAIQLDRTDTESLVKLAEVYEGAGDWTSAINVLLRLADVQRNNPERVKTLVSLGRIYATRVEDIDNAILAHRKALELDATNREAVLGLVELYEKSGRWADLARDASAYLQAFPPENRNPAIPLHIRLARIYESKLNDLGKATEELGRALEVDPANDEALAELGRIYVKQQAFPLALDMHRRVLRIDPFRVESLHAMHGIFVTMKEMDRAFVLAELLSFLRSETPEEDRLYQEFKDRVPDRAGALSRDEHESLVTHPDERGLVRYLLETIAPDAGKLFPSNLARFDVAAKDKAKPELGIRRRAEEVAETLGAPVFDVYLTKKQGMDLGVFVENADPLALVIGENVPRRMREAESNFLLGREIERLKGGHFLLGSVPNAELELVLWALMKLVRADFPTPREGAPLEETTKKLGRVLSKKARKNLEALANVGGFRIDFTKHTSASQLTANRAGLVVSSSIETCVRAIAKQNKLKAVFTNPAEARDVIGQHVEIRDLLHYAVSEEYFVIRKKLGLSIEG